MRLIVIGFAIAAAAGAAPGQPSIVWTADALGDGLFGYTFRVLGNDGLDGSFFANITFEGAGEAGIRQMKAFGFIDVNSDTWAAVFHNIPEAEYDMFRDSYFVDPFPSNAVVLTESLNYYHIEAGTGAASHYSEAGLGYVCATGNVAFYGSISRGGVNYNLSGDTAGGEGLSEWFTHDARDADGDGIFDSRPGVPVTLHGSWGAGEGLGYVVTRHFEVPGGGQVAEIVAVHSDPDFAFIPQQEGRYTVEIWRGFGAGVGSFRATFDVVPEPAFLLVLTVGGALVIRRRAR